MIEEMTVIEGDEASVEGTKEGEILKNRKSIVDIATRLVASPLSPLDSEVLNAR